MTIIEQMKTLGLTEYEAKAYLALLEHHPINGYALSKHSGIPRSRVYEVLDGLVKKQIAFESRGDKSNVYSPLAPEHLTDKLRLDFETTISEVNSVAKALYEKETHHLEPKQLKGQENIMDMVKVLMKKANHRVALSIWDEELQLIKGEVEALAERGILLKGMYFGMDTRVDTLVGHRRMDRYLAEYRERYLIAIIDDCHIISGVMSRGEEARATWSQDKALIKISDDYIAHDVMINTYSGMLDGDEQRKFEFTLDQVRKDYYGYPDHIYEAMPDPR